jgi:hypothetical protein
LAIKRDAQAISSLRESGRELRNIFDQYSQPENRLTHALVSVLDHERHLVVPFLKWLGVDDVPKLREIQLVQQQIPGTVLTDNEEAGQRGLPDAAFFDDDGWGVFLESKGQSKTTNGQLERHRKTAQRYGFPTPWIIGIEVDEFSGTLPEKTLRKT